MASFVSSGFTRNGLSCFLHTRQLFKEVKCTRTLHCITEIGKAGHLKNCCHCYRMGRNITLNQFVHKYIGITRFNSYSSRTLHSDNSIDNDRSHNKCESFHSGSESKCPESPSPNTMQPRRIYHKEIEIEDFTEAEPEIALYPGMEDDGHTDTTERQKLARGVCGVFDLADMLTLMRENNVADPCALPVPAQHNYVDHMVIGTCRSPRHLHAMAEIIRITYKMKRDRDDPQHVKVESAEDWVAIDLGNIAIHLFLADTRELYDLESLWSVGQGDDDQSVMTEDETDQSGRHVDSSMDDDKDTTTGH